MASNCLSITLNRSSAPCHVWDQNLIRVAPIGAQISLESQAHLTWWGEWGQKCLIPVAVLLLALPAERHPVVGLSPTSGLFLPADRRFLRSVLNVV